MARAKKTSTEKVHKLRPMLTPEAQETRCVSLAYDLVEKRLLDGSASSQETTHFLKIGSAKAQMELEKMRRETELTIAKAKAIANADEMKILYENALKAMRDYSGHGDSNDYYSEQGETDEYEDY